MPTTRIHDDVVTSAPGGLSPGVLAALEDFSFSVVTFTAGQQSLIARRNPRRTGMSVILDTAMNQGAMLSPRMLSAAEIASPTLQPGPILITMDLYRVCVMGEWYLYCPQAGNVSVFNFFRI